MGLGLAEWPTCPLRSTSVEGRRRPRLYHVVQENLDTLYGAVEDGALAIALPKFVRKELERYLACGLRCHGFARLKCGSCDETRLVPFERRPMVFEPP